MRYAFAKNEQKTPENPAHGQARPHVTALTRYARLECSGVWRPDPGAQRLEVVVNFGHASLVISDAAGRALSHWSLPATARVNPGTTPALYTPSAEAIETLEIADETMVDAIETVRRVVARARPRSGRVRALAVATAFAASIGMATWWLPDALVRHAVSVLPDPTRAEIGAQVLASLSRVSAGPCHGPRADRALTDLAATLDPDGRIASASAAGVEVARRAGPVAWSGDGPHPGILVVPDGIEGARYLPGGIVLVGRSLLEDFETPEVLAGHLLEADLRTQTASPLAEILSAAGPFATAQVLTTGKLPQEAVDRHAEAMLTRAPAPVDQNALVARFAEAGLSTTPFAYARDVTGESVLTLIEADPMRGKDAPPLMSDGDWVALQTICDAG